MSASASGASTKPDGDARPRSHNDGSSGRAYTVEQKAAVIRVRKCSATAFYDILGLEAVKATCSDGEIKKSYRKLSLLTHPDKNGYDGADEAFKMVSRAFQILSDPDKKSRYDKFGGDPDSRFGGQQAASSPFSGFSQGTARRGGGGQMFEEEISPEEMFRQFFGGGMGGMGGPFGPGFVFNMGGPGVRVHQFGGGRPRRRPHNHEEQPQGPTSLLRSISSLLPIILIFVLPLISSLFDGLMGGSDSSRGPTVRFEGARSPQTLQRISEGIKVPYWVSPSEVQSYTAKQWKDLDKSVENKYVSTLDYNCQSERQRQQSMIYDARGIFFTDYKKLAEATNMELKSCRRLEELGYRGR